ncbi:hypothetical protein E2C01_057891 [Portunus trituberculatus]|uniref:Uncharacterized protein n=1 Tax=Portunus trituberculatus TaxID=210409 RepID=A0A5B7H1L1_PORTR|nr:hypothetical protein [Portunus trituberculatus]
MPNITSWTDQVLATWAGAASNKEQDVLEFLSALAKANKDILHPAEELRCRLLLLRRQVVVDSLPRTFSDREKHQLLSSPFSNLLFDPAVVARVQEDEHLAAQQRALSSVVRGLASSFRGPLLQGDPFGPGVLAVVDPMAGVDLAREVVCSPVPVGACLQQHWREWMEINLPKSDLVPSQRKQYLGMVLDSVRALVFPSPDRINRFLSVVQNFLASLERLVPGSRTGFLCLWTIFECCRNGPLCSASLIATSFTSRQGLFTFTCGDSLASLLEDMLFAEGC